ncbi:MAG: hypothetical protein P1V19_21270 [Gimesia sp.]|nr:hypothetical protein [Gimesia sp.]
MSKYYFLLICVLPLLTVSVLAQDDATKPPAKEAKQDLRKSMLGAWVLLGKPGATEEPAKGARMKFWGLGHWTITQADPDTGVVIVHHGGTYTLDGDKYVETITFANENTKDYIGKSLQFKIEVEGDTYRQYGDGNPFTEEWRRLKK